jgi:CheY-like chemotaxis protein
MKKNRHKSKSSQNLVRDPATPDAGQKFKLDARQNFKEEQPRVIQKTPEEIPLTEEKPRMTRILLVEDSKFLRLATERALARAGYEVSTAVDGESALQAAREKMPDIVLLDMLLPKVTGPDVLKTLKSDPATAGINVVVLTSMSPKNADRLRKDGAYAFLSKDELNLDRSCEALLSALVDIVKKLNLTIPTAQLAAAK